MSDLVRIVVHLSDGSTVPISEPQPAAYIDTLRRTLDKRLDADRREPDPVQEDGVWVVPPLDRVFRVGTDEAGSLIPAAHIVRITWEAVDAAESCEHQGDKSRTTTPAGEVWVICMDCGQNLIRLDAE